MSTPVHPVATPLYTGFYPDPTFGEIECIWWKVLEVWELCPSGVKGQSPWSGSLEAKQLYCIACAIISYCL